MIDRFEGDWVVVEINRVTRDFERCFFPENAPIGDVVEFKGDKIRVLTEDTNKLRKEIEQLMDEVWED
ncbi:DUF3006 domain-containing protein [Bacillus sp. 1NLA3E]|uniref:DUF3006 domain-containing protein n=1 Tax=Bacillus sp. 1NLA3E TaxID=666686 RepID=UPI000A024922|nr:DUF3006 domain-containing protein [Bacillus sp. 1NLA3E]